jgi:hypothetical protein
MYVMWNEIGMRTYGCRCFSREILKPSLEQIFTPVVLQFGMGRVPRPFAVDNANIQKFMMSLHVIRYFENLIMFLKQQILNWDGPEWELPFLFIVLLPCPSSSCLIVYKDPGAD